MTLTRAARIIIPAHAAFSIAVGLVWALQDPDRTNTKALTVLNFWPIQYTGIILAAFGFAVLIGRVRGDRTLVATALGASTLAYLALAGTFLAASATAHASWSAALWPVYVAVAHLASMVSLAHNEGAVTV